MPGAAKNKIKYGLKNVHIAKLTEGPDGTITYATPKPLPGAVSMSLAPVGETTPFFADDIEYYTAITNQGYEGTLEVALIPTWFREEILNETKDDANVYTENSDVEVARFALLFEFAADAKKIRWVLYNCKAARPNIEGATKAASSEVKTDTLQMVAKSLADGKVQSSTSEETTSEAYDSWYTQVYGYAPAGVPGG